ncbi:MAG: PrsW family intramembrane metalloprotease [Candidatus Moraniibacteriota bacterium]|nr:MAG: PrsW family intramembrane metalloprotease [Candidatus Moranbacteria bacterium]
MIYAIIRGWLAGMAVLLIEILFGAFLFAPSFSPPLSSETFAPSFLPIAFIALLEEGMKFIALRGISKEMTPFFRNAIFKGLLVGLGFALFEICIKILFYTESPTKDPFVLGTMSSTSLHIITGGILGAAWFSRIKERSPIILLAFFLLAFIIHTLYNSLLAPILFSHVS